MKKILTSLALVCIIQLSNAQSADFKADVIEYMNLTSTTTAQIDMIKNQLSKMLSGDKLDKLMVEVEEKIPALNEMLANEMMNTFTQEEIKALIKFYKSPIGQSTAKKNVEFQAKLMEQSTKWGQTELTPLLMKYMK